MEHEAGGLTTSGLTGSPHWGVATAYALLNIGTKNSSSMDLDFSATQEMELNEDGSFQSTGFDPQFSLKHPDGSRPSGWYIFEASILAIEQLTPVLYIFRSQDRSLFWEIPLGVATGSKPLRATIFIPEDFVHLRFDPCDSQANFKLSSIRLLPADWKTIVDAVTKRTDTSIVNEFFEAIQPTLRNFEHSIWKKSNPWGGFSVGNYNSYQEWLKLFSSLDDDKIAELSSDINTIENPPLISIIMPVYNTPVRFLREAIDSVINQVYKKWELCIVDDASTDQEVRNVLLDYVQKDERIKLGLREANGNISNSSNDALTMCTGRYVALMDHDDVMHRQALAFVVIAIQNNPKVKFIYSDEDKIDENGLRKEPHFKSSWNKELLMHQNYINHISVFRRSIFDEGMRFRTGFEGAQDYDLLLRSVANLNADEIIHLPYVLYSWRVFESSGSFSQSRARRSKIASMLALSDYITQTKLHAEVIEPTNDTFRMRRRISGKPPLVSIIIPTRDRVGLLKQIVDGILLHTTYANLEIIIINNESSEEETVSYFSELRECENITVLPYSGVFNFSRMNNEAVKIAKGELILFLNNDIKVIDGSWLEEMVSYMTDQQIGGVGAKLLYENDTVQHGGVIVGLGGVAGHSHKHRLRADPGYFRRLELAQDLSAVTAACLLTRKSAFEKVGGFDDKNLSVAFNDVDYCLKLRETGYRIVFTPFATLYHLESVSRGSDSDPDKIDRFRAEILYMKKRWGRHLNEDRFYNPNLTRDREDFSIAWPPRVPWKPALLNTRSAELTRPAARPAQSRAQKS